MKWMQKGLCEALGRFMSAHCVCVALVVLYDATRREQGLAFADGLHKSDWLSSANTKLTAVARRCYTIEEPVLPRNKTLD